MKRNKLLIVDDETEIRILCKDVFSAEGYTVFTANDGEKALDILRHENIGVMFFDLKLPDMSGIDLCWEARKINPVSVIYAITGFAPFFQLEDCLGAGFNDYFIKPVSLEVLLKAAKNGFEKLERWHRLIQAASQ